MNLSSVVVIPRPERVHLVCEALEQLPGVEVALVSPEGKIIITIETQTDAETVHSYEIVSKLEDVMSAAMVFHQQEDEPESEITVTA